MPKTKIVASPIKKLIVEAKQTGRSNSDVGKQFHVNPSTVSKIFQRWNRENTVKRRPKSGQPQKVTIGQARYLAKYVKKNPKLNATDVKNLAADLLNVQLSIWAAQRVLRRANFHERRPSKKPMISKKNCKTKLAYARKYVGIEPELWDDVLWSDWTKINLFGSDGIKFVRRPAGKRFDRKYTIPTVKHGGGSIMVWGMFVF